MYDACPDAIADGYGPGKILVNVRCTSMEVSCELGAKSRDSLGGRASLEPVCVSRASFEQPLLSSQPKGHSPHPHPPTG